MPSDWLVFRIPKSYEKNLYESAFYKSKSIRFDKPWHDWMRRYKAFTIVFKYILVMTSIMLSPV